MSNRSDCSQLSGLSGVSTIACSSPNFQRKIRNETNLEKIDHELLKCEESTINLSKNKLVLSSLYDISTGSFLTPELSNKLKQILLNHHLQKYMHLPTDTKHGNIQSPLLGILNVPKPPLNIEEKKIIKKALEQIIQNRTKRFIKKFNESSGNLQAIKENDKSGIRENLSRVDDKILSHWCDKLDEVCLEYERDVMKCTELLADWHKLKYDDMEELNLKTATVHQLHAQIAEIQIQIARLTCTIKMFKETPSTIDAFKILSHDFDEHITNTETEIKRKKALKNQYEDLNNTEYDEVLKRYLDLRSTIKKEERLLEML